MDDLSRARDRYMTILTDDLSRLQTKTPHPMDGVCLDTLLDAIAQVPDLAEYLDSGMRKSSNCNFSAGAYLLTSIIGTSKRELLSQCINSIVDRQSVWTGLREDAGPTYLFPPVPFYELLVRTNFCSGDVVFQQLCLLLDTSMSIYHVGYDSLETGSPEEAASYERKRASSVAQDYIAKLDSENQLLVLERLGEELQSGVLSDGKLLFLRLGLTLVNGE